MPRKERHVVPNSEKAVGIQKEKMQKGLPSILKPKRKLWTGAERRQNRKNLNSFRTVKMERFRTQTAMEMIPIHQRIKSDNKVKSA